MMSRKVKDMEKKVEGQLVELLEQECQKLGVEIEKERSDNNTIRLENVELRKRIDVLSKRLEQHGR